MSNCNPLIFCSMMLAAFLSLFAFTELTAQDRCGKELADAEEKFQRGRLNEAIALATGCLEKRDLAFAESERAYKLLGKAYHAQGLLDDAKENLRKLLALIPSWQPDPENDSPSFQQLAAEVIQEVAAKQQAQQQAKASLPQETKPEAKPPSGGNKKWWWIGGGAIAAATAAAFLISRGEENSPARLPDPPAVPRQ